MVSKKYLVYLTTAAAIICFGSARYFAKAKRDERVAATATALVQILKSGPIAPPTSNLPMNGAISGSPIAEINDTYLRLHLSDLRHDIPGEALVKLGQCLRSGQEQLRMHCQRLSLDMLTAWTFARPESDWHRNPEIDAYFRIFKSTHYERLESFFERRSVNYEKKYLSQI